jgi:hypothetical protein
MSSFFLNLIFHFVLLYSDGYMLACFNDFNGLYPDNWRITQLNDRFIYVISTNTDFDYVARIIAMFVTVNAHNLYACYTSLVHKLYDTVRKIGLNFVNW